MYQWGADLVWGFNKGFPEENNESIAKGEESILKRPYPCIVVVQSLSCVQLFVTSWPATGQASLSFTILSLLLLLSRFSRVRLCETPWTAAYQASLSVGFSRQEHWSGLPFPSPMHESGK